MTLARGRIVTSKYIYHGLKRGRLAAEHRQTFEIFVHLGAYAPPIADTGQSENQRIASIGCPSSAEPTEHVRDRYKYNQLLTNGLIEP